MRDERKFIQAVENHDVSTVESMLFMDPGLVETVTEAGISILLYAAYFKEEKITELLLNHVSHLDIHEACAMGYLNEVKRNIGENKNNTNLFSADGFTPLILACYFGYYDIVDFLIDKGAKINLKAKNESVVAPVNSAVASGNEQIVKLLLEAGANPNLTQQSGITPLHSAAYRGDEKICKLLVEYGSDVMARSDDGRTALDFANESGNSRLIKLLSDNID